MRLEFRQTARIGLLERLEGRDGRIILRSGVKENMFFENLTKRKAKTSKKPFIRRPTSRIPYRGVGGELGPIP